MAIAKYGMLASVACGGAALLVGLFMLGWRRREGVFLALTLLMGVVAWIQLAHTLSFRVPDQVLFWRSMALLGELCLPVTLYSVMTRFMHRDSVVVPQASLWRSRVLATLAMGLAAWVLINPQQVMALGPASGVLEFLPPWGGAIWTYLLCGAVVALAAGEQLLRSARDPLRYQVKFVVIGVGGIAVIVVLQAIHMLLFGAWDVSDIWMSSVAMLLSIGLIVVGLSRWGTDDLSQQFYVSHGVLYSSVTFVLVGSYLLAVGMLAVVTGRASWNVGSALGLLVIFIASVALAVVLCSRQARAEIHSFIGRNFFRSKYDYRSQWLDVTTSFSTCRSTDAILDEFLSILGRTFGAPKVTIWMKFQADERFHQVRSLTVGASPVAMGLGHPVARLLEDRNEPVVISQPGALADDETSSFVEHTRAVVAVPLVAGEQRLMGFVTLSEDLQGREYTVDDFALLRVMGHHVAMLLMQAGLMEEQRASAEWQAVYRFSAFCLHDLKNLASGLSLVSQNAEVYGHDPEFQKSSLKTIGATVERMTALIDKLSIQRRPTQAAPRSDVHQVNVNDVVTEAVEAVNSGTCRPRFVPQKDLPLVPLSHVEFKHVVVNLLLNAQQAVNGDGSIRVVTKRDDDHVELCIEDNGPGMPEAQLQTLFQPFRTTKKKGLGIGLYQCKEVIREHGGALRIESREGRGTTVRILLPFKHHAAS